MSTAKRQKVSETGLSEANEQFQQAFRPSWADNQAVALSTDITQKAPANLDVYKQAANVQHENGVPHATPTTNLSFTQLSEATEASHEKAMWQLAAILFDEPQIMGEEGYDPTEKVKDFWTQLITDDAQAQIAALQQQRRVSPEELALLQLSYNGIWAATETLTSGKDFLLSTAIAQLGAAEADGEEVQKMIGAQIEEWRNNNTLSEIAPAVRALYELLAGNTCVSAGKQGAGPENRAGSFSISSRFRLDWQRAFALKLFYGITSGESVAKAVELYAKDVAAYREEVRPVPWFVEQKVQTGYEDPKRQDRQDILFGLLKIYAAQQAGSDWLSERVKLSDVISSLNLSGNPADNRLSFQLYQALVARGITDLDDSEDERDYKADRLTKDYAYQLASSADNLVEAVFVTLHLRDTLGRKDAVQALLNRYASAISDGPDVCPTFKTLVNDLQVPAAWIWNAKALHARTTLHDDVKECRYLLSANERKASHTVFIDSVAPRCIVEEDRRTITELLDLFKDRQVDQNVREWAEGAGVYDDYLKILHTAEKGGDAQEALHMAKDIGSQLQEMQRSESLTVRVAGCEMAEGVKRGGEGFARRLGREVSQVVKKMLRGWSEANVTEQAKNEKVLPSMPMASDEVLKRAEKMSKAYYGKIAVH